MKVNSISPSKKNIGQSILGNLSNKKKVGFGHNLDLTDSLSSGSSLKSDESAESKVDKDRKIKRRKSKKAQKLKKTMTSIMTPAKLLEMGMAKMFLEKNDKGVLSLKKHSHTDGCP